MKRLILILFCVGSGNVLPQILLYEFGNFENPSAISISSLGYIYVSDAGSDQIIKLDTLGKELKYTGGFGWQGENLDNPRDVASNTLNVYAADRNNNRIQIYDKDLNYLSEFTDHENEFNFPSGIAVSSDGSMYVLDNGNSRILKYDFDGRFLQEIGGYDAGIFALDDPGSISINNGFILVSNGNEIIVFDEFGSGYRKFNIPSIPDNINGPLIISSKSVFYLNDYTTGIPTEILTINNFKIKDAFLAKNKLYVLTGNNIKVYKVDL